MPAQERSLLDARGVGDALVAMGEAIAVGEAPVLVGIHTRGVVVAERLRCLLADQGIDCGSGAIDISLYRDDLDDRGSVPVLKGTDIPGPVDAARIVLCDDVLYTGRTIRAALDAVHALGRPARVELAVLVDRGHRDLPIQADVTGLTVETRSDQHVRVRLEETDGQDAVVLLEKTSEEA